MTTGEKLQKLRKENGYTQEQLSDILDVSRQTIYKWESDAAFPETDKLIFIAKMYHCSVDYLLNNENEDNSDPSMETISKQNNVEEVSNKRSLVLPIASLIGAAILFVVFALTWFNEGFEFGGGSSFNGFPSTGGYSGIDFDDIFKDKYTFYDMLSSSGHSLTSVLCWLCFVSIIVVTLSSILTLLLNKKIFLEILKGSNIVGFVVAFLAITTAFFDGLIFGVGSIIAFLILTFMGVGQYTFKFMKQTQKFLEKHSR